MAKRKYATSLERRVEAAQERLGPDAVLKIGVQLPDYTFTTLDAEPRSLSQVVDSLSLLVFFHYDCDACVALLDNLSRFQGRTSERLTIVLISSSNPLILSKHRADYPSAAILLYDHEWGYTDHLGITMFPLALLVSNEQDVLKIASGALSVEELELFCRHE